MINFQNQTLDIKNLPQFEVVEGQPIDKTYLKVLRVFYFLKLVVFFSILLIIHFFAAIPYYLFYPFLGLLCLFFIIYILETEKGFPRRKFAVREKDIIFQRGYFFFKQTIVPFNRIQHVEVKQDLIFRAFGIYSLKLFTAGSASGDLSLVGLNKLDADKLKAIILKGASADEN